MVLNEDVLASNLRRELRLAVQATREAIGVGSECALAKAADWVRRRGCGENGDGSIPFTRRLKLASTAVSGKNVRVVTATKWPVDSPVAYAKARCFVVRITRLAVALRGIAHPDTVAAVMARAVGQLDLVEGCHASKAGDGLYVLVKDTMLDLLPRRCDRKECIPEENADEARFDAPEDQLRSPEHLNYTRLVWAQQILHRVLEEVLKYFSEAYHSTKLLPRVRAALQRMNDLECPQHYGRHHWRDQLKECAFCRPWVEAMENDQSEEQPLRLDNCVPSRWSHPEQGPFEVLKAFTWRFSRDPPARAFDARIPRLVNMIWRHPMFACCGLNGPRYMRPVLHATNAAERCERARLSLSEFETHMGSMERLFQHIATLSDDQMRILDETHRNTIRQTAKQAKVELDRLRVASLERLPAPDLSVVQRKLDAVKRELAATHAAMSSSPASSCTVGGATSTQQRRQLDEMEETLRNMKALIAEAKNVRVAAEDVNQEEGGAGGDAWGVDNGAGEHKGEEADNVLAADQVPPVPPVPELTRLVPKHVDNPCSKLAGRVAFDAFQTVLATVGLGSECDIHKAEQQQLQRLQGSPQASRSSVEEAKSKAAVEESDTKDDDVTSRVGRPEARRAAKHTPKRVKRSARCLQMQLRDQSQAQTLAVEPIKKKNEWDKMLEELRQGEVAHGFVPQLCYVVKNSASIAHHVTMLSGRECVTQAGMLEHMKGYLEASSAVCCAFVYLPPSREAVPRLVFKLHAEAQELAAATLMEGSRSPDLCEVGEGCHDRLDRLLEPVRQVLAMIVDDIGRRFHEETLMPRVRQELHGLPLLCHMHADASDFKAWENCTTRVCSKWIVMLREFHVDKQRAKLNGGNSRPFLWLASPFESLKLYCPFLGKGGKCASSPHAVDLQANAHIMLYHTAFQDLGLKKLLKVLILIRNFVAHAVARRITLATYTRGIAAVASLLQAIVNSTATIPDDARSLARDALRYTSAVCCDDVMRFTSQWVQAMDMHLSGEASNNDGVMQEWAALAQFSHDMMRATRYV